MHARGRGYGLLGAIVASGLLLVLTAGCASGSAATNAYAEGRYESALVSARRDAARTHGAKRDRAQLTAGLAAHALGRHGEAIDWLAPLASNDDPEIAGRACAALGLIARDRGMHSEAQRYFVLAADHLSGLDGDRAAALAGQMRRSSSGASQIHGVAARRPGAVGGLYTVQIGAFSERRNAEQAASDLRRRTLGAGLGSPRIAPTSDRQGSLLYLVQVGQFADRHQAEVAARSIGGGMVTMARAY